VKARGSALGLGLLSIACLVVAYLSRDNELRGDLQGAYFDASKPEEGWTAYAPLDEEPTNFSRFEPFDIWDPYLWLGAGAALAIVAAVIVLSSAVKRRASP
jgi:hypothetical protein